jgi:hypothetical protein
MSFLMSLCSEVHTLSQTKRRGARVNRSNKQQSSTETGPNPWDPLCAPKHFQRDRDSGKARVVLSVASGRNPFQRVRSLLQAFWSRNANWPCNQESASRGKARTGLTESRHRNGPPQVKLSGGQAKDFMEAGPAGIQRDRQHQPDGLQSAQLAIAAPLLSLTPLFVKCLNGDRVQPFCNEAQIRLCHGYPPRSQQEQRWRERIDEGGCPAVPSLLKNWKGCPCRSDVQSASGAVAQAHRHGGACVLQSVFERTDRPGTYVFSHAWVQGRARLQLFL